MKHFFTLKRFFTLFLTIIIFLPATLFSQSERYPFNPYFLPPVFDKQFPNETITKISLPENPFTTQKFRSLELNIPLSFSTPEQELIYRLRKNAFRNFLRWNISSVNNIKFYFAGKAEAAEQIRPNIFRHLFTVEPEYEKTNNVNPTRYAPKRKYWITEWNSIFQFSQSYMSQNWYKGGIGNLNLLSVQKITANYQKNKLQFNNLLEWNLSFYTTPSDSLRSFRLGEDLVRTYSDFGLEAFGDKFFYSSNLEMKTKLFRSYKENTLLYTSTFLSPLEINVGIFGIKYQLNKTSSKDKYKKTSLTADLSPLSVQYTWVADSAVMLQNRYGIPADKGFLLNLGSTLNAKITINFNKQTTFNSRIKYFTNYKKTICEVENELNISLNRFFSTRLYLYGRFDDTPNIKRDDTLGYVQLYEMLTFGFKYTW